jgi:hypothetical protein
MRNVLLVLGSIRVIGMDLAVLPNQIVRQLVTKYHPPIYHSLRLVSGILEQFLLVKLLEIVEIAEYATCPIETNRL